MKIIQRLALSAALAIGCASLAQAQGAARDYTVSKSEREALQALQTAVAARDASGARTAYSAAQAAAQSSDGRYLAGALLFRLGLDTGERRLQLQGIDAMVASGAAEQAELPALYRNQASLAASSGDNKKAEAALTKLAELKPDDVETLIALAQIKSNQKKTQQALTLLDRALAMQRASGQPVPESWYKFAVRNAFDARMAPETAKFARDWLTAYPSQENWRDAITDYRDLAGLDKAADLDALRLMRFTRALAGERDYYMLADNLIKNGTAAEAKAVLDEGIAAKAVEAGKGPASARPNAKKVAADNAALAKAEKSALASGNGTAALNAADGFFGLGEYGKAATLYRAALQKGSVDAALVNTRLGMALALSGNKAEAEAALRAVTGPRSDLAGLILVWVTQRS
jgi:hypothetical protein